LIYIYSGIGIESFNKRVSIFHEKLTKKDELCELINKINDPETVVLLKIVKALMA